MPVVKFSLCSTDIGATRSYATPYKTITPGTVLPNFSLDASREYRRSYVHPRDRKISIDNVPTMLLPKARIREDFDLSELRDLVFPDNSLQKVHLAALHPNGIYGNSADQKRIWFEDISNTSGSISNEDGECDSLLSYLSSTSSDDRHRENIPQHLESFGTTLPEVNVKSRKPLRGLSAPDEHDDHRRCSSCNQLNEARERVLTYFGGVEYFLSWVLSKWRKGRESEHPPRKQFLIGRYVPHFCSFVNRLPLHERPQSACRTPRKGWAAVETGEIADDSTSIFDLSSRRSFSTSGFEGRATSPSSVGTHGSDGDGGDGDEGGDGRGDSGDDRGTRGQNNKRQTKIDVKITPVRSDRNGVKTQERKGIVNFGFPVSKPPPFLSNKPSKTKKVAKKTTASKKSKKENSSKSKTSKSSAQQNKPVTVPPDAIILLEQIVDAAGGDKDGSDDDTRRSRSCMRKKEKKVVEKPVKEEEKEEEVRPDIKTEERIYDQPTTIFDDNKYDDTPELPQVDSQLPELPVFPTPEPPKEPKSQQSKQRSLISAPSSLKSSKLESDDESRTRPEFDIGVVMDVHVDESTPKPKVQPWLQGRLALSQQSSRFELPMDMKLLESMSPLEYLRRHCVISTRRQNLYQKMFQKHKDKAGVILYKDLEKALNDVLVNAVNTQRLEYFSQLLQIPDDIKLDCRLFSCIAALIERLLYPVFLTDDTADLPGFQKEKIECADFCALDWKFHGVKVNPPVERLLKSIA